MKTVYCDNLYYIFCQKLIEAIQSLLQIKMVKLLFIIPQSPSADFNPIWYRLPREIHFTVIN